MIFETERLVIREYRSTDWEAVHVYAQQESILIYQLWGPNTEADTRAFIALSLEDQQKVSRKSFELAVTLKSSKQLIGGCGFVVDKANPTRAEFGYIINPVYWNAGYATEASLGLINYMISQQGISEVAATCDSENAASARVLQKCGLEMVREVLHDMEIKGRVRDTWHFERIV